MPTAASMLAELPTPALALDAGRMAANIARLRGRLDTLGVPLRPHLKTCKSLDVARRLMPTPQGPCTVSTLAEAEHFAEAGVVDILYAVGIAPDKLARIQALRARGVDVTVILDSVEQAEAVAAAGGVVPALIEIDCDGHRAGVLPDDRATIVAIGQELARAGALRGVMTHAGGSYDAQGPAALQAAAEAERAAVVQARDSLLAAGLPCPVVSVGSTPTAHFASDLTGVTEVRAGVFVFFDLVMAGIGVCQLQDIALSVLATVIGHRRDKGWILVDAGWMALSRDRGTASQRLDQGYGVVCDLEGRPYPDLVVALANQEHGVIARRDGGAPPDLPVGTRVRILPNHACATAAQHDRYHVLDGDLPLATWPRFGGW